MINRPPLLNLEPDLEPSDSAAPAGVRMVRMFFRILLYRTDWLMIIPMAVLLIFGEMFIYGTGQQVGGIAAEIYWKRNLTYMAIGGGLWLFFSILDYRWCGLLSAVLYPISIGLLVAVLFFGRKFFGARSWLSIGSITFQPSELAKFALILLTAWILSAKKADINRPLWLLTAVVLLAIPAVTTGLQPDLGTAATMIVPISAMIFTAKLKWRILLIFLVAGAVILPIGFHCLKPYQKERIMVFFNPDRDRQNRGWTQYQSEIAVGAGGFAGRGFMNSKHNLLGYLPRTVSNSDFIFPVIAEETGFLGSVTVVLMFILLLFAVFRTALLAPDLFGRFICVGTAMLLFFHVYVNIAMCIRMSPVTGLPLPLVSYGGTFLIITMAYLGIVHSVYGHRERNSIFDL